MIRFSSNVREEKSTEYVIFVNENGQIDTISIRNKNQVPVVFVRNKKRAKEKQLTPEVFRRAVYEILLTDKEEFRELTSTVKEKEYHYIIEEVLYNHYMQESRWSMQVLELLDTVAII